MAFKQSQVNKVNSTLDIEYIKELEKTSEKYREFLKQYIEYRIGILTKPMMDFDQVNYELSRAAKDGGAFYLNIIKEILE